MDVTFERNLYEQFKVGSTNLVPSSQNDVLEFEGTGNIAVSASSDKITISETSPANFYTTIQTDSGNVDAESAGSTVKFTNATTSNATKAVLTVTGSDTTNSVDEVRLTMAPDPKVGFGSQLVVIEDSEGEGSFDVDFLGGSSSNINTIRYKKYACAVITFDPDTGNVSCAPARNSSGVTQQELWDFSLNSTFDDGVYDTRTNPECSGVRGSSPRVSDLVDPSGSVEKFTYVTLQCGEVLLAQKTGKTDPSTGAAVYVIGMTSNLKVFCT